jgi:uncharacterized membrane protein
MTMSAQAHLWAIGFDDMTSADQVRGDITALGWGQGRAAKYIVLFDAAVVVRHPDGSYTFDRERFPAVANVVGGTLLGFLAGLALGAPFTGAAIGAVLTSAATAAPSAVGIDDQFVRGVEAQMKPGTSVLFVLDDVSDLDAILDTIRGRGGKVLKTNVDLERARLIQSTLAKAACQPIADQP